MDDLNVNDAGPPEPDNNRKRRRSNVDQTTEDNLTSQPPQESSIASQLQNLLAPLKDGTPLDLTVLAFAHLPTPTPTSNESTTAVATAASSGGRTSLLRLFESHVGPYDEVIDNAARLARWATDDKEFCVSTGCEPVDGKRFEHPNNWTITGPRPDLWVWVALFWGRDVAESLRPKKDEDDDDDDDEEELDGLSTLRRKFEIDVRDLPIAELLINVLRYLREEVSGGISPERLLRFASVYGLSGAMTDILQGKYGTAVGMLSIDDALCVSECDCVKEGFRFEAGGELFFPPYAIGAVLGHNNVVRQALMSLGGTVNPPYFLRNRFEMRNIDTCAAVVLSWVLKTNQPDAVRCLVTECGFQFRWLNKYEIDELFGILFHIERMLDEFGPWRGRNYDPERHWDCNRTQRKYRARLCYEEKQKMLRTVIESGMPFELFVPTVDFTLDREALAKAKALGKDKIEKEDAKRIHCSLTKAEKKARRKIWEACVEYNAVQRKKNDTLFVHEFYDRLRSMWENQPAVQLARLPEFEQLDPRWREERKRAEEGEDAVDEDIVAQYLDSESD